MNHWFLVGRDIMWIGLCLLPLFAAAYALDPPQGTMDGFHTVRWFMFAIFIQATLMVCIYTGIIK